jgi:hypothetical protein
VSPEVLPGKGLHSVTDRLLTGLFRVS